MSHMPWRSVAVLLVVVFLFSQQSTPVASTARTDHDSAVLASPSLENDNNLIDRLFQSFNGNTNDNGGRKKKATIGPLPPPVSAPAPQPSATDAEGRARAGRDTTIFLANDRVVVRVPPALSDDIELGIRIASAP